MRVFRTDTFEQVAAIPVGALPHGVWPSGDGSRIYVGLENGDALTAIDTKTNRVIATIPAGQAAQAIAYVPDAVPQGEGLENLKPLGVAGRSVHLSLAAKPSAATQPGTTAPTSVSLFDQGLVQVLQAAVTGLDPKSAYVLAIATQPDGGGKLEVLQAFMTNPADRRSSTRWDRSARSSRRTHRRMSATSWLPAAPLTSPAKSCRFRFLDLQPSPIGPYIISHNRCYMKSLSAERRASRVVASGAILGVCAILILGTLH